MLYLEWRNPSLGLVFVPAGTHINTLFKALPLGCWPRKSSSKAIQGKWNWLGPTLWFFSSTHVYSYSYQSTGFVSLTRQDLICSTCELPIPHDWSYLCHYQSTTLPAESYWAFLFYMEKDCCKWHYKFCLTFISFSATARADQACWHRGHLQVLLLPGEGVGKALHRLWFVLSHLGLDGLRYLLNYWVDLFQKTMGLIDLIHLRGKTKEQ